MSLQGRTILFFAGPLYEDLELWYPKIRLEEEGARTVVAGTGEKTYQGKRGYPLTVDASVDDLKAGDFDGVVIPGGYAPDVMRRSQKLLQLTRDIYEAGKPVAFICHAGWVPISAGIVRGKRGTSVGAIKDDLVNAGMLWEDSPVVVDGNLISSRTPADLPVFMKALIAALEGSRVTGRESPVAGPLAEWVGWGSPHPRAAATDMGPPASSTTTAPPIPWDPAVEPMPVSSAPPTELTPLNIWYYHLTRLPAYPPTPLGAPDRCGGSASAGCRYPG